MGNILAGSAKQQSRWKPYDVIWWIRTCNIRAHRACLRRVREVLSLPSRTRFPRQLHGYPGIEASSNSIFTLFLSGVGFSKKYKNKPSTSGVSLEILSRLSLVTNLMNFPLLLRSGRCHLRGLTTFFLFFHVLRTTEVSRYCNFAVATFFFISLRFFQANTFRPERIFLWYTDKKKCEWIT